MDWKCRETITQHRGKEKIKIKIQNKWNLRAKLLTLAMMRN